MGLFAHFYPIWHRLLQSRITLLAKLMAGMKERKDVFNLIFNVYRFDEGDDGSLLFEYFQI